MPVGKIIVAALAIIFIVFSLSFNILADLFWFQSMELGSVYMRILTTTVWVGMAFGLVFLAFSSLNYSISKKINNKKHDKSGLHVFIVILVLSFLIGMAFSDWEPVMRFQNQTSFGVSDPIFGMDVSFYVFTLPFYQLLLGFAGLTLFLTLLITIFSYLQSSVSSKKVAFFFEEGSGLQLPGFEFKKNPLKGKPLAHICILIGLLFFVISSGIYLSRYGILFSRSGTVFGAGYTDVFVSLPLIIVLSVLTALIGIAIMANSKFGNWKLVLKGVSALIAIGFLGAVVTGVFQALVVSPNEFNLERPYIENNINATLNAYRLDSIEEMIFPLNYNLTKADINENSATISNIRIWDWRPLSQTFNQLQLFRSYYEFSDVDIDRYTVDGKYKQVMMSVREMNTDGLQAQAQTWVNKALVYTHGYGTVMIPVDRATNGLPEFFIKDIPPQSVAGLPVERPEIYFGEKSSEYALVNTDTKEFDYPSGDQNIFSTYQGNAGVKLDVFKKFVYAVKFKSFEIFLSNSLTSDSRILLNRNIIERANKIAPFLYFDQDPYIVLEDGRLYWLIDAYTLTDAYPYSEMYITSNGGFNYMKNSVKVVVDAYNGDVTYYVMDDEPIISTYRKMFPEIFKDFKDMPDGLKAHIRYPEDLFTVQASIYSTYHMKDPQVFYNREDVWVTPDEIYRDGRRPMLPYYIIMRLPGEEKEEFVMIMPFTPKGKENMIAWVAAKSDVPNYGEMVVYRFSKQTLAYGPMQIEARIDQDTDISQSLTLWDQSGSSVIRGNTLVIPIKNSIMYIEPLYLEANEKGTLPELKRIIVAYGDRLTMKETLNEAIEEIFGTTVTEPGAPEKTSEQRLAEIETVYRKAQDALRQGDLTKYAEYMDEVGRLLGINS